MSAKRQTVRGITGTVQRDPTADTVKAKLNTTLVHVNENVVQEAVIADGIPLAVLESVDGARAFFDTELRFQVEKAIDAHVIAKIMAATPPNGTTVTGLPAQVRDAVAAMRSAGTNPDLLVVDPTDAVALDLYTDGSGALVFGVRDTGCASPLWSLWVIESITVGTDALLLDCQALGVLYTGPARMDADPYAGVGGENFARNLAICGSSRYCSCTSGPRRAGRIGA